MEFVKKHYEKIILSAVLAGLVGALVVLPFMISRDQEEIKRLGDEYTTPKVPPLPALDLTRQKSASERLLARANFDFFTTNKLFNPMDWKKGIDGNPIKIKTGNETGAGAAVVTKITPLYLVVTLDQVTTNELGARYVIGIERQAAATPALRQKQKRFASMDDRKKDAFTLVEVKGAPENPSELILKLADSGEMVSVSKQKPFKRADAYAADLKYDLDKKTFIGRRENSSISFGGEDYIVVAIDPDEVILSAQSNQKHTTLRYTP
ncbi:MAG: hypothetical protein PHY43_03555 [Verrucomicrobiales bacterium]|nr:hypothetical protein [Verrucomicrobiales bacterium]